jgi:hypothetical protein
MQPDTVNKDIAALFLYFWFIPLLNLIAQFCLYAVAMTDEAFLSLLVWLGRVTAIFPVCAEARGYARSWPALLYSLAYLAVLGGLAVLFVMEACTMVVTSIDWAGGIANSLSTGKWQIMKCTLVMKLKHCWLRTE